MSLTSWKKEFYPVTAHNAVKKLKLNDVQLVEHALLKWEGLKPHNLLKHDMECDYNNHMIIKKDKFTGAFEIDSRSCSLCVKYILENDTCDGCPLFESLGGVMCDRSGEPYSEWTWHGNPTAMLKALRKAKKWAEKNGN